MTPLEALRLLLEASQHANMPAVNHQHCLRAYELLNARLEGKPAVQASVPLDSVDQVRQMSQQRKANSGKTEATK